MPLMVSGIRSLEYAGKVYLEGQTFEASEKDAQLLFAVGRAGYAPAPPLKAASMTADDPPRAGSRRSYSRRDMRTED